MAAGARSASIRSTIAARRSGADWCWGWRPAARRAAWPTASPKRIGPQTYAYLREREQPTETYVEARVAVRLADGRRVEALSFLSDRTHPQWAGALSLERQAELIDGASGLSGRNVDYLADLVEHLREAGIRDRAMETLLAMVLERSPHP